MDLNGVGHVDILSGSYSRQTKDMAGLFQVLWGSAAGFKKPAVLNGTDGEPLIIKADKSQVVEFICTRPFAIDWNGDQKLDLVVGNFGGSFYVFTGEGKGKFAPGGELLKTATGSKLKVSHHSDPFCIDWDGDGDVDILSGSASGGVYFAENVAKKGAAPKLSQFRSVIPAGKRPKGPFVNDSEFVGPTTDTRIWVDDVNGDGKLDILVGDSVTLVSPAKGMTEKQALAKQLKWDAKSKQIQNAMQKFGADTSAEERNRVSREYSAHYRARSEFLNEQWTGFVWLYARK